MSRRHHHHNIQPYDYERFSEHPRDQRDQTRGIEYQDDSLSSINSEEESYLHHHRTNKEKKSNFSAAKVNKSEKGTENETKTANEPSSTVERLGRLESLLEELIKRNHSGQASPSVTSSEKPVEKNDSQFFLEPRRHDFTTSMWINKIQEVSVQNNWSEKSTIQYMGTQMSGIIKAWYNSLPNYDFTWPEWKILITKIFPDNLDFVTTLKRLVTRLKQANESIATYYFSKMYLIEACKITGEDAVSCLIDGLNNQLIQEQAKAQNFLTPETLYSQFLMSLPDYNVDYSPSGPPTTAETVLNNWYYQEQEPNIETQVEVTAPQEEILEYEKEDEEGERNEEYDYRNFHEKTSSHSVKAPMKRPGTVHSRLDKRFIRSNHFRPHNKIPMAARVCSICFNRGHLARNCRNANKILRSTLLKDKSKKCFYKNCQINNHTFTCFIDTGCTTVAIRQKEAKFLDLIAIPQTRRIEVYGGGYVDTLGDTEFFLEVDDVKALVRGVIVPDHVQDVSIMIGQEFLTRKDVAMFLRNETLNIFALN